MCEAPTLALAAAETSRSVNSKHNKTEEDANYSGNSENIDVSRCPTAKQEDTKSYAHKSVEADSTMQQPEQQAKRQNIEKTETESSTSKPSSQQSKVIK